VALTAGMAILQGCRTSPWESEYRSAGAAATPLVKEAPVRIREVPWERIQATLVELDKERTASDIHPDDWDAARKLEAKAKLLRGLQISEDPRSVEVLGRSVFRTTDAIRPDDGVLMAFARKKGATTVVWSSSYMGKTDVVRSEPVTEWRTGSWQRWNDNRGSTTWSESSTIWVPIVISADERAWMAFFLREPAPAVSAAAPVR
jgi:hypothetical protein